MGAIGDRSVKHVLETHMNDPNPEVVAGAGAGGSGSAGGAAGAPGGAGNGGIPGNGGNGRLGAGASEALFFLPFLRPTWFTPNPVDGNAVLNLTLIGTAIKANF